MKKIGAALALLASASVTTLAHANDIDSRIQPYAPVSGVSGSLKSIGSDSLNNLMTLWAEGFRAVYPSVTIEIEGKGSSTAPPALIAGTAQLGPMSRPMRAAEKDQFEAKYGYKPTEVRVAVDTLAVFVNKDNPVSCLSLTQVDSIFSVTRNLGGSAIDTWDAAGGTGDFAGKPISLFGRNAASGTYGYFKEVAMGNGDFRDTVKEQPGSSAVVQGVASDKYAIGYSGIGYKTADVRAIAISGRDGQCHEPNQEEAYKGLYPITRFLYVYVNKNPSAPLDPVLREFFKFALSKEGQEVVIKDGYYSMPYVFANEDLAKISQ